LVAVSLVAVLSVYLNRKVSGSYGDTSHWQGWLVGFAIRMLGLVFIATVLVVGARVGAIRLPEKHLFLVLGVLVFALVVDTGVSLWRIKKFEEKL